MRDRSAVILAGGSSSRFGKDKGLMDLADKPLIKYVLDAASNLVEETIVVVSSNAQAKSYTKALDADVKVLVDAENIQTPLIGALTGFDAAHGEYSLLLPCDVPFVSKDILALLLDLCTDKAAAIPRQPNAYMEPLHAVYCTKPALDAARTALNRGELNMKAMVEKLRGVRYVSSLVLQQLDPDLRTFFNVNTPSDLKRAEAVLRK
ncbi:molybdenum cofactor guanylyltransferase [Candidatus Bathyarchaeota archaeon]|nr:molybdenum cofactor guanylyltransferase [Candidatus Bathyarchaeota archaeon]